MNPSGTPSRFRPLTILAIALSVGAVAGPLNYSNSIADRLEAVARERLGRADLIIDAPGFVREALATELAGDPAARSTIEAIAPAIVLQGAIAGGSSRRVTDVTVYGVDERFWRLHGSTGGVQPADAVALSPALSSALGVGPGSRVVIETEEARDAPLESIHGRREEPSRALTLDVGSPPAGAPVDFQIAPAPGDVHAALVPLDLLQQKDVRRGRVNTLLVAVRPDASTPAYVLEVALKSHLTADDAGLTVRIDAARATVVVESRSGMIDAPRQQAVEKAAFEAGALPTPVLTAVVESLIKDERRVGYSFIASLELQAIDPDIHAEELSRPPIVLNNWTAGQLAAKPGDTVRAEFPTWVAPGRIEREHADFEVAAIVPISGPSGDPTLTPDLPGLTGTKTIAGWMPRFPFDHSGISPADEAYWARYGSTPKAFVPPPVGRVLWPSPAGTATSIRISPPEGSTAAATADLMTAKLQALLDPRALGLRVRDTRVDIQAAATPPRSRGIDAVDDWLGSAVLAVTSALLAAMFLAAGHVRPATAVRLAAAGLALGIAGAVVWNWSVIPIESPRGAGATNWPSVTTLGVALGWGAAIAALLAGSVGRWHVRGSVGAFALVIAAAAGLHLVALRGWLVPGTPSETVADAAGDLRRGTGGYALVVRTTFPIAVDPDSPEGLDALGLSARPTVRVTPLKLHDGDDVGSGNPYNPLHPRVLGVPKRFIEEGRFAFSRSLERSDEERANPWLLLDREQHDPSDPSAEASAAIVPIIAAARTLQTVFHRSLGDEIAIQTAIGPTRLRFVAALADSVLDDAVVMSETHFRELFPADEGYRVLLVDGPQDGSDVARDIASDLRDRLRAHGVDVSSASERLGALEAARSTSLAARLPGLGPGILLALAGIVLTPYLLRH
jgi:hypothetical protein